MSSYSTPYRHTCPEYYEKEKAKVNEKVMYKYNNNPAFLEKMNSQAKARCHTKKI